jgi:predicted CDP-diglyceride synthetase/phosphatidate cytidylyltransferase
MPYQEKENIVNILSGLLITGIYAWIVYQRHLSGSFDLTEDYRKWGIIFLIFIVVSIVARIIIYIIFHILNYIATREEDLPVSDERDKLIKLKSTRNAHYVFTSGFVLAIISLAIGMPVYGIFIAFVVLGLISEIVDNASQLFYSRKGV